MANFSIAEMLECAICPAGRANSKGDVLGPVNLRAETGWASQGGGSLARFWFVLISMKYCINFICSRHQQPLPVQLDGNSQCCHVSKEPGFD